MMGCSMTGGDPHNLSLPKVLKVIITLQTGSIQTPRVLCQRGLETTLLCVLSELGLSSPLGTQGSHSGRYFWPRSASREVGAMVYKGL